MVSTFFDACKNSIRGGVPKGITGFLEPFEDAQTYFEILRHAPRLVGTTAYPVLLHGDANPFDLRDSTGRHQAVGRIRNRLAKRYVVLAQTQAGPRILKINDPKTGCKKVTGLVRSQAKCEHHNHTRAAALNHTLCNTQGYMEWRVWGRLQRTMHIQTLRNTHFVDLGSHFTKDVATHGIAACVRLGEALARTHGTGFVHADLKPFHVYVEPLSLQRMRPQTNTTAFPYRLRWIDLGYVWFHASYRRRLINLYQLLRYIVPHEPKMQHGCIHAYCNAAKWQRGRTDTVLRKVRHLVAHRHRTLVP